MRVRNSKSKELLKFLAVGSGIVALSLLEPRLPTKLLAAYMRKKRFQRSLFLKDLRRLQERKLIDFREEAGGILKITLTRRGQEVILRYNFEELKIKRPRHWDGKWRLVIFDIPESHKRAREALRWKLKQLGFYPLQKSVFIHPFPCEDEIDFVSEVFGIRRHLLFLTIPAFEGSEKLAHHFGLTEA